MWYKKAFISYVALIFSIGVMAQGTENKILSHKVKSDTIINDSKRTMTVVTTETKVIKLGSENSAWTNRSGKPVKTPTLTVVKGKPGDRFPGRRDSVGADGVHYYIDTTRSDNGLLPQH